jgi:hypothetical protein
MYNEIVVITKGTETVEAFLHYDGWLLLINLDDCFAYSGIPLALDSLITMLIRTELMMIYTIIFESN